MEIKTPDLGVDTNEVTAIYVKAGDVIIAGDDIILLDSDKYTVKVQTTVTGRINNVMVSLGDIVSEGVVLLDVEVDSEDYAQDYAYAESEDGYNAPTDLQRQTSDSAFNNTVRKQEMFDISLLDSMIPESVMQQISEGNAKKTEDNISHSGSKENSQDEQFDAEIDFFDNSNDDLIAEFVSESNLNGSTFVDSIHDDSDHSIDIESERDTKTSLFTNAGLDQTDEVCPVVTTNGSDSTVDIQRENETNDDITPTPIDVDTVKNKSNSFSKKPKKSNKKPKKLVSDTKKRSIQSEPSTLNVLNKKPVYAGPIVRGLARQMGVNIEDVDRTTTKKRIAETDLFNYVRQNMISNASASIQQVQPVDVENEKLQQEIKVHEQAHIISPLPKPATPLPDMSQTEIWGEMEPVDLSLLQKDSVSQLHKRAHIPQVTQFDIADISELQEFCQEFKQQYALEGVNLTILPFIIKATAKSLVKFNKFNSHLNENEDKLILRKSINMGVSISTENGIVIPVVRDVQDKTVRQIAIELEELTMGACSGRLQEHEMKGASFTISPLGKMGGVGFTPLLNWPQVGIIGVSETSMQPKWNASTEMFEAKLMLPVSMSYDYRVINEADAELFTRHLISLLEDIRKILL